MASSIIIKTKCLELARFATLFVVIQIISLVPTAFAQHYKGSSSSVCDKYCFASCSEYFPGPEFSTCVRANVDCNCSSKVSTKNPFVIFVIVALVLFGVSLAACCYRFSRKSKVPLSNRVIAQPVVSTINAPSRSNGHRYQTSNSSHVSPQRGYTIVAAPAAAVPVSDSRSDVPPEYSAPPPYNECVINVDQQKY